MTLSIRIRTSEDVRASKKDKVRFYLLSATFLSCFTQPRILFLWIYLCDRNNKLLLYMTELQFDGEELKIYAVLYDYSKRPQ